MYFQAEDGYLRAGCSRRKAQGVLQAEPGGGVRLLPVNGAQLTKNHVPVRREGSLVGPRDVIRFEGLEVRYENYREK